MKDEKILQGELLSEEELDQVAGGSWSNTAQDSEFLFKHKLMDDWYYTGGAAFNWGEVSSQVDKGWARAGITCCTVYGCIYDNEYWKDGKKISRKEAYRIVNENFPDTRPLDYRPLGDSDSR